MRSMSNPLNILITNYELDKPSGTVMVVRDLALGLHAAGHRPGDWLTCG